MRSSEQIGELAKALAAAQGEMRAAPKMRENPHFRSKYADLAGLWAVAREPLSRHGLAVVQTVEVSESGAQAISTMLCHESGQWISSTAALSPQKPGAQALGSEITYLRRYCLASIVGLVSDDDDDAEGAEYRPPAGNDPAHLRAVETMEAQIAAADSEPMLREWASDHKGEIEALPSGAQRIIRAAWAKRKQEVTT